MPVPCESKYIGQDYPGVSCFSVADGEPRCKTECLAVRTEVIVDEILDDARGRDGDVDPKKLARIVGAAMDMLGVTESQYIGDDDG